jgi:hypothetical protein
MKRRNFGVVLVIGLLLVTFVGFTQQARQEDESLMNLRIRLKLPEAQDFRVTMEQGVTSWEWERQILWAGSYSSTTGHIWNNNRDYPIKVTIVFAEWDTIIMDYEPQDQPVQREFPIDQLNNVIVTIESI